MKMIKNQINIPTDQNMIASPVKTYQSPIIIGLRTYLYIPIVINIFVNLYDSKYNT